jgi:hypothetical protein
MSYESETQRWMRNHPNDVPCPSDPDSAKAWRRARGLQPDSERARAERRKYEQAMAETRTARASS